ncbi:uncharacterized protein DEA37_0014358 [Paragonimus westermani]|uniref:Uncharacterized protein n=1 Tax=Paragonimus westermani TaxID=34504 RepID=A0A5J4NAB8_9TREM|nr:uncharacterized protein DEA37_0014358 [Paragonimus westermani]
MYWPGQDNANNRLDQTSQGFYVTVVAFLTRWFTNLVSTKAVPDSRKNVVSSHSQET